MKAVRKNRRKGRGELGAVGAGARVGARVRPGADRGYGREVAARALEGGLRGSGSAGRAGGWPLRKLRPRRGPIPAAPRPSRARPAREALLGGVGWGARGPSGGRGIGSSATARSSGSAGPRPHRPPAPRTHPLHPGGVPRTAWGGVGRGAEPVECRLPASRLQRSAQKCPGSEALPRDGGTFLLPPRALLVSPSQRGPSPTERTPGEYTWAAGGAATPYLTTT